jgi:acyl dehydratase
MAGSEPITVGTEMPETVIRNITVTDIVRHAGASGDFNPIHHDPEFAGPVFAMGTMQAGMLAVTVAEWLGPENCRRFRAQFRDRVWPGDDLTLRGRVTKRYHEGGEELIDLDLEVLRQTGSVAIQGGATFALP